MEKPRYRFNAEVAVVDRPAYALSLGEVSSFASISETIGASDAALPPRAGHSRSWKLLAAGAACLLAILVPAAHFFVNRNEPRKSASPIRLTSFSPELSVSAAAISPDGKTLAYANAAGIFLEETSTKETRRLPSPSSGLRVSSLSWFPDGNRLLATRTELRALAASVWIIPAKGAADSERVGAYRRAVVSPDGSQIVLMQQNGRVKELLLLPTGGGPMRCVAVIPPGEDFGSVFWSLDGQRLHFVAIRWDAQ
jgi:hypothetical protein